MEQKYLHQVLPFLDELEEEKKQQLKDYFNTAPVWLLESFKIEYMEKGHIFVRENKFMHMSASSWIVNKTHDKVLMIYHKIYDSWSWLGGHADGNMNLLEVACKELEEESGVKNYSLVSEIPFSLEVLTVDGHIKKNQYVNSHLHLNITSGSAMHTTSQH